MNHLTGIVFLIVCLIPLTARADGGPYKVVAVDLTGDGIVDLALMRIADFKERAARVGVSGHREYHAGWHTALDLRNLLTVSEAIARSAIERKESRGGHFREDYPDKVAEFSTINVAVRQGAGDVMEIGRIPIPPIPDHLKQVIEEQKS